MRDDLCYQVNATTKTIVFESTGDVRVPNWKSYFKDTNFLAKHFLVQNLDGGKRIARHYTICNAMRTDIFNAYISALKPEDDDDF